MKVNFYKKTGKEKELILTKELPLDEIDVYVDVLKNHVLMKEIKEKGLEEKHKRFVAKYEDNWVDNEVIRDVIMEYKDARGKIKAVGDISILGW